MPYNPRANAAKKRMIGKSAAGKEGRRIAPAIEGCSARRRGLQLHDNPYPLDGPAAGAWADGWKGLDE